MTDILPTQAENRAWTPNPFSDADCECKYVPPATEPLSKLILIFDLDATLLWEFPPLQSWDGVFEGVYLRPGLVNFLKRLKSLDFLFMVLSNRRGASGLRAVQAINAACGCQILPDISDPFKCIIRRDDEESLVKHLDRFIPCASDRRRCILVDDSIHLVYSVSNIYHSLPAFAYAFPKLDYLYGLEYRLLPVLVSCLVEWNRSDAAKYVMARSRTAVPVKPPTTGKSKNGPSSRYLEDYDILVCRDQSSSGLQSSDDDDDDVRFGGIIDDPVGHVLNQYYPANREFTIDKSSLHYDRVLRVHCQSYKLKCQSLDPIYLICEETMVRSACVGLVKEEVLCHLDKRNDGYRDLATMINDCWNDDDDAVTPVWLLKGFYRDFTYERLVHPDVIDLHSWAYLADLNDDELIKSPLWNLWKRQYTFCSDAVCPVQPQASEFAVFAFESVVVMQDLKCYSGQITSLSDVSINIPPLPSLDIACSQSSLLFVPPDDYVPCLSQCLSLSSSPSSSSSSSPSHASLSTDAMAICETCSNLTTARHESSSSSSLASYRQSRFNLLTSIIALHDLIERQNSTEDQARVWLSLTSVCLSQYLAFQHACHVKHLQQVTSRTDVNNSTSELYRRLFPNCAIVCCSESFYVEGKEELETEISRFIYRTQNSMFNHESTANDHACEQKKISTNHILSIKSPSTFDIGEWCHRNMICSIDESKERLCKYMRRIGINKSQKSTPTFQLADKTILPLFISYDNDHQFIPLISSHVARDLTLRLLHQFLSPSSNYYQFCFDCQDIEPDPADVFELFHFTALKRGITNLFIMLWIDCSQDGAKEIRPRHIALIKEFCRPLSRISGLGSAFLLSRADGCTGCEIISKEKFVFS